MTTHVRRFGPDEPWSHDWNYTPVQHFGDPDADPDTDGPSALTGHGVVVAIRAGDAAEAEKRVVVYAVANFDDDFGRAQATDEGPDPARPGFRLVRLLWPSRYA